MDSTRSFQRLAAVAAIISAPLAIGNMATGMMAVDYDFDVFSNMRLVLDVGAESASLWRWSNILDIFGYYLLIIPLTLFLWSWFRHEDQNRANLYAFCLLAYSFGGAIGATVLAAVWPPLIEAYSASPDQAVAIGVVFDAFTNAVYGGLWNILGEFFAGVGFIGFGLFLRRERRAIGTVTLVLGIAALVDALGTMAEVRAVSEPALYIYLVLAPVWALWLGIDLLRRQVGGVEAAQ